MSISLNEEERIELGRILVNLLEDWKLRPEDQLRLLGLEEMAKPRHLAQFQSGKPLPETPDLAERARRLLGIQHALQQNNPANPGHAFLWLHNRNKYFPDRAPIEVMLDDGVDGLQYVWTRLDCTQHW